MTDKKKREQDEEDEKRRKDSESNYYSSNNSGKVGVNFDGHVGIGLGGGLTMDTSGHIGFGGLSF